MGPGRSHFEFLGAPDRAGKLAFLQTLDVLSVPATRPNQKGQFLLEAMASGVPVVQPRSGVFTEIVENTGGGILTEAGDIDGLANALLALATDGERRRQLGARAYEGVRARYGVSHMLQRVMAVYERCTALGGVAGALRRQGGDVLELRGSLEGVPGPVRADPRAVRTSICRWAPAIPCRSSVRRAAGRARCCTSSAALEPPTSGTVSLNGENPFALDDRRLAAFRNRHVGFVFQDHHLLPQCSVLENVLVPSLVAADADADIERRARALIDEVGLGARLHHRPHELSGGENASASRWRARWCSSRRSSCATSRRAASTRRRPTPWRRSCSTCTAVTGRFSSWSPTTSTWPTGWAARYRLGDARLHAR